MGVLDNKSFVFVSCGDFDGNHLASEARCKGVKLPSYLKRWINLKKVFPVKVKGMTSMLEYLGLVLEGRHHSGIDDARNISKCAIALLKAS